MGLFNFLKKKNKNDLYDADGNLVQKSAIAYDHHNNRFLSLKNDDCAIVLHDNNNVEVIFSKFYDAESQKISDNEEVMMALATFMKQPGFLEMIIDEFRKLAKTNIEKLTDQIDEGENK